MFLVGCAQGQTNSLNFQQPNNFFNDRAKSCFQNPLNLAVHWKETSSHPDDDDDDDDDDL